MPTIGQTIIADFNTGLALPIANLTAALHTNVTSLAGILLDPAYDVQGSLNHGTLAADLLNPLDYASCYPTAEHLFPPAPGLCAGSIRALAPESASLACTTALPGGLVRAPASVRGFRRGTVPGDQGWGRAARTAAGAPGPAPSRAARGGAHTASRPY